QGPVQAIVAPQIPEESKRDLQELLRETVASLLPTDPGQRRALVWASAAVLLGSSYGVATVCGVSGPSYFRELLPSLLQVAGLGWVLLYPGVLGSFEWRARNGTAHLHEPDFKVTVPLVEPAVGLLTLLAGVSVLFWQGVALAGMGQTVGHVLGMGFGILGFGVAASALCRPLAERFAQDRAYRQYLAGGAHQLQKGNPRRARRMFERAIQATAVESLRAQAREQLKLAVEMEANDLRQRGRHQQAKELLMSNRQRLREEAVAAESAEAASADRAAARGKAPKGGGSPKSAAAKSASAKVARPPRLLDIPDVRIATRGAARPSGPQVKAAMDEAAHLQAKGRHREAFELHLSVHMPAAPELARDAAKDYIAQGLLRSAEVIYAVLGERQIPEFYGAVAAEWTRNEGFIPAAACRRLAKVMQSLDQGEAAASIACRGALAEKTSEAERMELAKLAVELCQSVDKDPPPEVLEAMGEMVAAAMGYEQDERPEDAARCYRSVAEDLLARGGSKNSLIPLLSKLFLLEPQVEDRFLGPLVEHVLSTGAVNAQSAKILQTYRARHPADDRVTPRLVQLMAELGRMDDALTELRRIEQSGNTKVDQVVEHYRTLQQAFPEQVPVRLGLARALVRSGKVSEAASHAQTLIAHPEAKSHATDLRALIENLFDWGHVDVELRRMLAEMKRAAGDEVGALEDMERYVRAGGRHPAATEFVAEALRPQLVTPSGSPNYEAHHRLALLYLHAGSPSDAVAYLEVLRGSTGHRGEAELLLARAELAASNPTRAVQLLLESIGGRSPTDTPEQHYELARAYERLGETPKAQKIDHALDRLAPGFTADYVERRPVFERADTAWMPGLKFDPGHTEVNEADEDTDPGTGPAPEPERPAPAPSAPSAAFESATESAPSLTLDEALAPRYRLRKRLGSGGMGDVHLAEDLALGREVAIKVLRRTLATDLFLAKFRDEARIVAQLSHPGIVGVYDIGQKGDWAYIVMELVRGPNLAKLVSASHPPPRGQLVAYCAAVADAMAYAHSRNVIHRDLKPANILVGMDGVVKVTDFGIARVLQSEGEETAFSAAGLQVGTVNFMAPEQIRGEPVDPRTDIYLLATTLYHAISRKYPFVGDAVLVQKVRQEGTPVTEHVSDVSIELDSVLRQGIARDPRKRFDSMEDFAIAMRETPEYEDIAARR
ncbi:MAG TPA: serine/threonine-protein kinase, partial [Myxococcales bacterium LLY-WYZ-16_1]|nr:serine/threonine-protein kinase [Myxococcales bacterium LLY-WYZ-16_1]